MSRTTITPLGAIAYRTRNMEQTKAAAFARCIEANAARFRDVQVCEAHTATPQFYVQFRPTSAARQADLYEAAFNARKDRADREGAEYLFWPDPDHAGSHWCFNPLSGETYQVETFSCSCPDYQMRCSRAGLLCKHQQALTMQREAGTLGQTDKVTRTPTRDTSPEAIAARATRCAASVNLDF